ncbi:MAG TPA: histidine kinase [Candidatus Dormibacteraeota bacterium]|nr:histidine kinase [Candidatus Dormibacteraeota bacterium]
MNQTGAAQDLFDVVLQRLFATGLAIQVAAAKVSDAGVAAGLHEALDELDATMRLIRGAIAELEPHVTTTGRVPTPGTRAQ